MSDLANLRDEHARLLVIVGTLSRFIEGDSPPDAAAFGTARRELARTLIGHLRAEDWVLYPQLLDSLDARVTGTARAFNDEMGGLAAEFMDYAQRWDAPAIAHDWPGYRRETAAILNALTLRIVRENDELYPLVEQRSRAA